jgi:hypothetical protein
MIYCCLFWFTRIDFTQASALSGFCGLDKGITKTSLWGGFSRGYLFFSTIIGGGNRRAVADFLL